MKGLLFKNFPNSIYSKILTNPNFQEELALKTNEKEEKYQLVHQNYL